MTALLGTGTTDWTSTDARLAWGGVSSPPTSFAWHVYPVPQFSERFPISFTTASFQIPGPGDVAPGAVAWDFQANAGVQTGFESGHTQCTPNPPVQIYATFLPAGEPACAHAATTWTCRFSYTGATQLWQVPADVTRATVDLRGASGMMFARGIDIDKVFPGGRGGEAVATVAVTPGEYLALTVGGSTGYNGGGQGLLGSVGISGGGASDVRRGSFSLADRLIVAGGGGGGGYNVFCFSGCPDDSGGAGGGVTGSSAGGGPGTQSAGGAAQTPGETFVAATPGSFGTGGSGAAGGGGGYYGGGGSNLLQGSRAGGGGGGSGLVPTGPGNTTVAGTNSGDGSVSISYTSATTPYTSRYGLEEARWLRTDLVFLHTHDLASTQHNAAMFMTFLGALIRASGSAPPNLGSAPGTGPVVVTSTYTPAENASLLRAATLFPSDPPTLQHTGIALLAFLIALGGH